MEFRPDSVGFNHHNALLLQCVGADLHGAAADHGGPVLRVILGGPLAAFPGEWPIHGRFSMYVDVQGAGVLIGSILEAAKDAGYELAVTAAVERARAAHRHGQQ